MFIKEKQLCKIKSRKLRQDKIGRDGLEWERIVQQSGNKKGKRPVEMPRRRWGDNGSLNVRGLRGSDESD